MKSWDESESIGARWSEVPMELWPDWNVAWERCSLDYQGFANVLLNRENEFVYVTWSYGSCGGCDGWEDMDEEKRKADFKQMAEHFKSYDELIKWVELIKDKDDYEGMYEGLGPFMFDKAVEEKLSKR